jgi:DNA-binding beta-propeller fold protein YncE
MPRALTMTQRVLAVLLLLLPAASPASGRMPPVLVRLRDIPVPGPPLRFDYQSLDTTSNRLYVSHMNAGHLLVFDLGRGRVESTVSDLPHVTGVCVVPTLGKIYASVPGRRQVAVIDTRTMRIQACVGTIGFPDGIAYVPDVNKVYVSDESGGGELVIDGRTNEVVTTIPFGGEAGNTIFDPGSGRILVAVQTRNEIAEIDPRSDRVVARHELPGGDHPHGMVLDPVDRLLFVANEGNAMLLTVDLESMRVLDKQRVAQDPDVLAYDAPWARLYVAAESGVVSVFTVRDRRAVHDGDVAIPHAHTVSVDPRTHLVYLPLQNIDGHPVLRIMSPRRP